MGSSRTLVAPGIRTLPHTGWRSGVVAALTIVLSNPSLWLLGAVGFAVRGGILLLALVIVILPTPVEVRSLLGDYLASSGLTAAFFGLAFAIGALLLILVALALLVAARVELAAFERFIADPESGHEPARDGASAAPRGGRRGLLARLFLVQLAALAGVGLAALPLGLSLYEATMEELLRPTPGGVSLYLRILSAVREPLSILVAGAVAVDLFSAYASRQLMGRHFGIGRLSPTARQSAAGRLAALALSPLRRPLGALATLALAWLVALAVLAPMAWALDLAWDATRAAYLSQLAGAEPRAFAWLFIITVVFATVWAVAVLMAGFVSALRAGLWSAEATR